MFRKIHKAISIVILAAFIITTVKSPAYAQLAPVDQMPFMPKPGVMVHLSPEFTPAYLKGIVIHPENALKFDFIIYKGDKPLTDAQKRVEYTKLTKYFLASLAIPDDDQWVNLSPYEKDRIIKNDFGKTEMGRDLLAQDYMLKQVTASIIYPEDNLGKKFWERVYAQAREQYGTTQIPVNTFNKVWIIPDHATIYEKGNTAYVLESHLKVMLDEDYLSLAKHTGIMSKPPLLYKEGDRGSSNGINTLGSKIVRQIVLPALEREVNEGKNFATLRQVYSGVLLAAWYKRALKESFLSRIYADRARVKGVDQDPKNNEMIYRQYLRAYKKGVFNFIKEDVDKYTNETIPRKYFSGGWQGFNRDGMMKGKGQGADFAQVVHIIKPKDITPKESQELELDGPKDDLAAVAAVDPADMAMTTNAHPLVNLTRLEIQDAVIQIVTDVGKLHNKWDRNDQQYLAARMSQTFGITITESMASHWQHPHDIINTILGGEDTQLLWEETRSLGLNTMELLKESEIYSAHLPGERDSNLVEFLHLRIAQAEALTRVPTKATSGGIPLAEAQDVSMMTTMKDLEGVKFNDGQIDAIINSRAHVGLDLQARSDVTNLITSKHREEVIRLMRLGKNFKVTYASRHYETGADVETPESISIEEAPGPFSANLQDIKVDDDQLRAIINNKAHVDIKRHGRSDVRDLINGSVLADARQAIATAGGFSVEYYGPSNDEESAIPSGLRITPDESVLVEEAKNNVKEGLIFLASDRRYFPELDQYFRELDQIEDMDELLTWLNSKMGQFEIADNANGFQQTLFDNHVISSLNILLSNVLNRYRKIYPLKIDAWDQAVNPFALITKDRQKRLSENTLVMSLPKDADIDLVEAAVSYARLSGIPDAQYIVDPESKRYVLAFTQLGILKWLKNQKIWRARNLEVLFKEVWDASVEWEKIDDNTPVNVKLLGELQRVAKEKLLLIKSALKEGEFSKYLEGSALFKRIEGISDLVILTHSRSQIPRTLFDKPIASLIGEIREVRSMTATVNGLRELSIKNEAEQFTMPNRDRQKVLTIGKMEVPGLKSPQMSRGQKLTLRSPLKTRRSSAIPGNNRLKDLGGIDMNVANLNMKIKRDGNGVPLPMGQQDMASLNSLEGLEPVILGIRPATSLPFFSQLQATPTPASA